MVRTDDDGVVLVVERQRGMEVGGEEPGGGDGAGVEHHPDAPPADEGHGDALGGEEADHQEQAASPWRGR